MNKNTSIIWFSVTGSLMSIAFMWIVNQLTSPDTVWFVVPSLFMLFWPGVLFFAYRRMYTSFAVFGSLLFIALLVTINLLYSPEVIWYPYAVYPFVWWPIATFSGKKAGTLAFAWTASVTTILYYALLNAVMSPGYPWAIYPAYAVLWWPMSLYYSRKKDFFGLSVAASLLSIVFFITVNYVSSPQTIWAIYPIFGMLWWPLSMYYFYHLRRGREDQNL